MPTNSSKTGILLMTYGSATQPDGVRSYMEHIYKGKASEEIIEDFENRYRLVGGSPLVEITKKQAAALEKFLNDGAVNRQTEKENGADYVVQAAMLHSAPFIGDVVLELKEAGVERLRGVILSPQFSSFIMDGYSAALIRAAEGAGFPKEAVSVAEAWPSEPHFIRLLADRVRASLEKLEKKYACKIPVLFTTHSLPQRVVEKDPHYLEELTETIAAATSQLKDLNLDWHACYQSAGHTPEPWLKPDLTDILSELGKKDVPAVLIAPIQFLADHLEILYDLDIAAKEQCAERSIAYNRIELPNADPLFVEALASVARN